MYINTYHCIIFPYCMSVSSHMKHNEADQSHDTLLQFKFWHPQKAGKTSMFQQWKPQLVIVSPKIKQIILQGTRKHDIPPNGNFEQNHQLKSASKVSGRILLPSRKPSTLNLNPSAPRTSSTSCKPRWLERYSSGECRNDTHSVKPRCMKRQWDAAWNRNTAGLDSEKCQWWKYGGGVEVGRGNLESAHAFF